MSHSSPSGLVAPFLALFRVVTAASSLLSSEAALAKAEARQAAGDVVRGVILLAVAVFIALVALFLLAEAAVHGLIAAGLPHWGAALVSAVVLLVIAGVLIASGLRRFNASQKMTSHVTARVNSNLALVRREWGARDDV